jgi:glycosyltransferase involved in cell wall biosynthesis
VKVLQVTTHFNVGGITNYILSLSRSLATRGVDTTVASAGGDLEGALAESGIAHKSLNIKTKFEFGPKAVLSGFALAGIVRREKIDLMHAHTRVSQVAAAIASALTGVPYVTTCHGYFKKRARGILDTWGVKVIAISDAVRKHLTDDLGVPDKRVARIFSGVDTAKFSVDYTPAQTAALKKEIGLKSGPVIGTIGRLSSIKGQKYLVEAMKDIIAARADVQCLIVGDGDEKEQLQALAGSRGVDKAILFVKSCPDTHKYLALMDVFVFPSVKEGLGIALLEALASGRACVASRIGGIADIISDGVTGTLVDVGDPAGITRAVIALLKDDAMRRKMGDAGRELVRKKFTLYTMAENIARLYKEVLR